jgi:hypothetical protein
MLIYLALATAAISFTISRSSMPVLESFRMWIGKKSPFFKELFHCPYCCSHWVAAAICLAYRPRFVDSGVYTVDYFVSWWAVVGAAAIPIFMMFYVARQE